MSPLRKVIYFQPVHARGQLEKGDVRMSHETRRRRHYLLHLKGQHKNDWKSSYIEHLTMAIHEFLMGYYKGVNLLDVPDEVEVLAIHYKKDSKDEIWAYGVHNDWWNDMNEVGIDVPKDGFELEWHIHSSRRIK